MKRTPSPRMIQRLIDELSRRQDNGGRRGVHITDLTLCLRKAYYSRTSPREPTPETLGYYVDGGRRDFVIKGLLGTKVGPMERDGIWFTPDSIDESGNPIEIKTTRAIDGISRHYITQLAYYMVLLAKDKGRLIIQRVGFRRSDVPFEAYDLEFEEGEMSRYRQEMLDRRDALSGALEERDPGRAPSIRFDPESNWLCRSCPWNSACREVDERLRLEKDGRKEAC